MRALKNLGRQPYHTCPQPVHIEACLTVPSARYYIKVYINMTHNMLTRANGEICFIVKITNEGQGKMSSSLEFYFLFCDGADELD